VQANNCRVFIVKRGLVRTDWLTKWFGMYGYTCVAKLYDVVMRCVCNVMKSSEDGSKTNSRNVVSIKYASVNGRMSSMVFLYCRHK
jgi:hypothetical protein